MMDAGLPVTATAEHALLAYRTTHCSQPAPFCARDDASIVPDENLGVIVATESQKQEVAQKAATFFKVSSDPNTPCYLRTAKCMLRENILVPDGQESAPLTSVTVPPVPVSRYDGTYTGSFSVQVRVADQVIPVAAPFSFSVSDGVIQGYGEGGKISPGGRFQLSAAVQGIRCTWGGRIIAAAGSRGTGEGGIFCSGSVDGIGFEMTGRWDALR